MPCGGLPGISRLIKKRYSKIRVPDGMCWWCNMVFSSVVFVFVFLPAVLACYFLTPRRLRPLRNLILLVFSLAFYAFGEPVYVLVMLFSISINYILGFFVEKTRPQRARALACAVAVVLNIGVLIYFKYTGFFVEVLNGVTGLGLQTAKITMPIGISFFTFQGLSYVLDVYFGTARVQKNPLNVALYVSFFPQLIAGPIVRYETIAEQIEDRDENLSDAAAGISRFIMGFGKKILIANNVGLVADAVFSKQPGELSFLLAWFGLIAYSLQIYFDFSGYSDMAIGLGRVFGFHFLENFNYPYISQSITEFWRRWHISLGTWFRDYVYIPLGGNRGTVLRHIRNIAVVWLLTGFWHGAAWNFIAWGLYFGVLLVLEKYLKYTQKLWKPLRHLYALLFILLGWVLFRSPDIGYALGYVKVLFGAGAAGIQNGETVYYLHEYGLVTLLGIIACLPVKDAFLSLIGRFKTDKNEGLVTGHVRNAFVLAVFALSIVYLVKSDFNPFIYFRF